MGRIFTHLNAVQGRQLSPCATGRKKIDNQLLPTHCYVATFWLIQLPTTRLDNSVQKFPHKTKQHKIPSQTFVFAIGSKATQYFQFLVFKDSSQLILDS